MRSLWDILGVVGQRRKYLVLLILRMPFDFLLNLSRVFFLRDAFCAREGGSQAELYRACVSYALASVLLFTYNSIIWRLFAVMYIQVAGKIRIAATDSIVSLSLLQVEEGTSGDYMMRLNLDADMTVQILGGALNIPHFIIAVFHVVCTSIMLLGLNVRIFMIVMSFVIPHLLLSRYIVARPMTRLQSQVQLAKGELNTILSAMITMSDTAVLYDAGSMLLKNYKRASGEVMRLKMRMTLRNAFGNGIMPLFSFLGYLALLLYVSEAITAGSMQFGEFTAVSQLRSGILMGLFMGIRSYIQIRMNMAGLQRMKLLFSSRIKA